MRLTCGLRVNTLLLFLVAPNARLNAKEKHPLPTMLGRIMYKKCNQREKRRLSGAASGRRCCCALKPLPTLFFAYAAVAIALTDHAKFARVHLFRLHLLFSSAVF